MWWLTIVVPIAGFLLLYGAVGFWEKHPVASVTGGLTLLQVSELRTHRYLTTRLGQLLERGYHVGSYRDLKHPVETLLALSPDRTQLVLTGQGTVVGMATAQTWIYTRTTDGMIWISSDLFDSGDQSGKVRTKRFVRQDLPKLIEKHEDWLSSENVRPLRFPDGDPADVLHGLSHERAEAAVQRGRAYWVDGGEAWRLTPTGVAWMCMDWFKQLGIGLTQFWRVNRLPK